MKSHRSTSSGKQTGFRKAIQHAYNGGPHAAQLAQLKAIASGQSTTQLVADEEEHVQGKFKNPAQLMSPEEEHVQGKFAEPTQLMADEEEHVQGKFAQPIQRMEAKSPPNTTGMPDGLKHGVEQLSGLDMSDVNVHFNSSKPAQLNALAYAQGNQIHLAPGQESHLPHEAWHVAQQKQGRVAATTEFNGTSINDDVGLESEADSMGSRAAQFSVE